MKLFEACNGREGLSYIRVYVWAENEAIARDMATHSLWNYALHIGHNKAEEYAQIQGIKELFDANQTPFCTLPSDDGWEVENR